MCTRRVFRTIRIVFAVLAAALLCCAPDWVFSPRLSVVDGAAAAPAEAQSVPSPPAEDEESPSASISGKVLDEDGYAIQGATVELHVFAAPADHMEGNPSAIYRTPTLADGGYEIAGIKTVGWAIPYAIAKGYVTGDWHHGFLEVSAKLRQADVNITLKKGAGFISGKVVSRDGAPIPTARVDLIEYGYTEDTLATQTGTRHGLAESVSFAWTDEEGQFEMAIPAEGLCDFKVSKQGFGTGYFPGIPVDTRDTTLMLASPGAVSGKATWSDVSPAVGAQVDALGLVDRHGLEKEDNYMSLGIARTLTDDQGRYTVDGLSKDCTYVLGVRDPAVIAAEAASVAQSAGGLSLWAERARRHRRAMFLQQANAGASVKRDIAVAAERTTTDVDLVVTPCARIHGKVTDIDTKLPAHELRVKAREEGAGRRGFGATTCTDAKGAYTLVLEIDKPMTFEVGWSYKYTVSNEDGCEPEVLEIGPGEEKQLDLAATAPVSVSVRFINLDGSPCTGISSGLRSEASSFPFGNWQVDTEGRLEILGVQPGHPFEVVGYVLAYPEPVILGASQPIRGAPGETLDEVIVLCTARTKGGFAGTLVDSDGKPISNQRLECWVRLEDGRLYSIPSVTTRDDGRFLFVGPLPEAVYPEIHISCVASNTRKTAVIPNLKIVGGSIRDLGAIGLTDTPVSRQEAAVAPGKPVFETRFGFDEACTIEFGRKAPTQGPITTEQIGLKVRGFELGDALRTPKSVALDQAYELVFLPIVDSDIVDDCQVETYLIADAEEALLGGHRPYFMQSESLVGKGRIEALKNPARIDLSAYQGHNAFIEWRLRCETKPAPFAAIGDLRLRPKSDAARKVPSILFICSDAHPYDLAFGDLMPNLETLRKGATLFTHAYSTATWTLPSVTSIFTGLFPRYHLTGRLVEEGLADSWDETRQPEPGQFKTIIGLKYFVLQTYPQELVSLPELLNDAGYVTALVTTNVFYDISGLLEDGPNVVYAPIAQRGDLASEAALELLDVFGNEYPLFMVVHYGDIHDRGALYGESIMEGFKSGGDIRETMLKIPIRHTDQAIGKLLGAWKEHFEHRDSLIAFWADHGEQVGEMDPWGAGGGHGSTMNEVLLHVPLLVKFPAALGVAPSEVDSPVSLADLAPTVLELLRLDARGQSMNGRSLPSVIGRQSDEQRYLFADYQLYGGATSSVRKGGRKLIVNFARNAEALIDTQLPMADKGEGDQVTCDPAVQAELEDAFLDYIADAEAKTAGLKSTHKIDPKEVEEQLRAGGYLD